MELDRPTSFGIFSQLKDENGVMHNFQARKRPLDKDLLQDDDDSGSPVKVARKCGAEDVESLRKDRKICQEGMRRMREYRQYLSGRERVKPSYQQFQNQLKVKQEIIAGLLKRVTELEAAYAATQRVTKTSNGADEKCENLEATEDLLSTITDLDKENQDLRKQVSDLKMTVSSLKKTTSEVNLTYEGDRTKNPLASFSHCCPLVDLELLGLRLKLSNRDEQIQQLKKEKNNLQEQQLNIEANLTNEKKKLQEKISELEKTKAQAELEFTNEQIRFTEHLANTSCMIIVESKNQSCNVAEPLQSAHEQLQDLAKLHQSLRRRVAQFPQLIQSVIEATSSQLQAAIRETDERNKELVSKYTHEIKLRKLYHNQLVELRGNIRVFCRVRPCLVQEEVTEPVVSFDPYDDGIILVSNKGRASKFHMDKVFAMDTNQSQVFEEVSCLVRSAIDGFNVCIFAYGQTGSGKTHTMEGTANDPGVNQRALQLLYEETKSSSWQYTIEASMMEIYNETLRDLLNPDSDTNKLEVKMKPDGGLHVPGLVSVPVSSLSEVNQIIETGRLNRATASTCMNERSSRSHCLLCVNVTGLNLITGNKTLGRLNLVDLAGSERVSRSQAEGARLKEAQSINKSLSSLGDVINALKNKHNHIPYRNSKLTYLLQESLGGDSKTLMILQVSPGEDNLSESICTLTFGQRVRSAELGMVKKRVEDNNKASAQATPTTPRPSSSDALCSPSSGSSQLKRTPNLSKSSPMLSKIGLNRQK